jgi:hypothetical protein
MSVFYDEGVYTGEILEQAMTTAASSGNPQFALRFLVLSYADGEPVTKQYERKFFRTITEKTASYFQQDLDLLGFTGTTVEQLDPNVAGFQDFTGKQMNFYCSHEDTQDHKTRERWSIARGVKPIQGDPVPASDYRRLNTLLGFKAAAKPAAVAVPAGSEPLEITDEDVPF